MICKNRFNAYCLFTVMLLMGITALVITVNAATITVTSPNGGENWARGTSHAITWTYTENPGSNVNIAHFKGGGSAEYIVMDAPIGNAGSGSYSWPISSELELGSDYKIGIEISSNMSIFDYSDNNFTISISSVASFTVNTTAGTAPLAVQFTDTTTNTPTAWNWSFRNVTGNNTQIWFSTVQNPSRTFGVGNYSIVLNASNNAGYNFSTQVTFINVSAPITIPPLATFTPNVTIGTSPLAVTFTDTSVNTPTAWNWSFRNVAGNNTQIWFSTVQNPAWSFGVGNYSIVLNASNNAGYNLSTQNTFINVTMPAVLNVSKIGVYRNGEWIIDNNDNFTWDGVPADTVYTFGGSGNTSVYGDWDGNGKPEVGVYSNGTWYLDYNGNGIYDGPVVDRTAMFGQSGFSPVVGDWDGTGKDKIGVEKDGFWTIDYNGNYTWDGTVFDRFAAFGQPGDNPVVGDWDGTGTDKIGSMKDGFWAVDYNGNYTWDGVGPDRFAAFGWAGVSPIVGDWDGTGTDKIGSMKDGFWAVDYNGNYTWDGVGPDRFAGFGQTGDKPAIGDWDGNGKVKIGSFKDGFWAIDYDGSYFWDGVGTDRFAAFGMTGDNPVVAKWR